MDALPQNMQLVGETGSDLKIIYIHQKVYHAIRRFSQGKTEHESGGILMGQVINKFGKGHLIIEGFVEAKYSKATPTTMTFTHETWNYVHHAIEKKHKGRKIIGWFHTHPDFGIFLSENDRFIHNNFFPEQSQVAYVVDPVRQEEGFFLWGDNQLEKSTGFYVFDENGKKIHLEEKQEDYGVIEISAEENTKSKLLTAVTILALVIAIFSMVVTYQTHMSLKAMESRLAFQEIQFSQILYSLQTSQNQIKQSEKSEAIDPNSPLTDQEAVSK